MNPVTSTDSKRHAIVIGGSMAGLWAGRVLSDHFDRVTILDRDRFPDTPEFRSGVPQAHHLHLFLARGLQILEQLFPDLLDELTAAGAVPIDIGHDAAFVLRTGWAMRFRTGVQSLSSSRVLLEWAVRNRLAKYPAVSFVQGAEVVELLSDEAKTHVTGVRLRYRRSAEADAERSETLSADLVVDTSGRDSHAPEWLEKLGYQRPEETIINSFLSYATRWYKRPAGFNAPWKLLFIGSRPPDLPRGGGILEVEGDRWIVTIAGAAHNYPPTDEAGFLEFSQTLLTRALYDAIKDAEPISPIYGYQNTANQLRHYEKLARLPENFVVLGDAACGFNPIYGQGMTAAGMGALALDECLRQGRGDGLAMRFQKRLAKVTEIPWLLATGEDFRYPTTEGGQRTWFTRFNHRYVDYVQKALPGSKLISQTFTEVTQLVKPPTALFQPAIVGQVVGAALKQRGHVYPKQFEMPPIWQGEPAEAPPIGK